MTGGMWARALRARGDSSSEMTVGAVSCGLIGALTLVLVAVPSLTVAAVLAGLAFYAHSLPAGCNAAALQLITPPRLRGQAAALFMLVGNTLGLGLTPLLVALITDYVFGDPQMVGRSLQVVALLTMPLAVVLLYRARGYFQLQAAAP
jgi:MFS family permease